MINVYPIKESWLLARDKQPRKNSTYTWISKFENALLSVAKNLNHSTSIGYCDSAIYTNYKINYTENSPVPFYFKMSPGRYYIDTFQPALWHNTDIDSSIYNKYINSNKYQTASNIYKFNNSYILFALQSANFREKALSQRLLIHLIYWAESTKNYILFKLHPFTGTGNKLLLLWNRLVELKLVKKYAVLVSEHYNIDNLIENARAVWTYSSGVALQALVKNKPVAVFSRVTDYIDICSFVTTPEQASNIIEPDKESVSRFLTWYYNKLIIDVNSLTLETAIEQRIDSCVRHNYDLVRIFS